MVAISIADDGPGVPPEVGDRVFDMFLQWFQPRRRQPPQSGAGTGAVPVPSSLPTEARSPVSQNQPHGAVFRFTLPAEEVAMA